MTLAEQRVLEPRDVDLGPHRVVERNGEGCVLCTAAVDAAAVVGDLAAAVGVPVPRTPGEMTTTGPRTVSWLSPRSWLIHLPEAEEGEVVAAVDRAFPERTVLASRYGHALCRLDLAGAGIEDALRQGGFLSLNADGLAIGRVKRTLVAAVPVLLWRTGPDTWTLGIERSRAGYFVDWLAAVAGGPDLEGENR